MHVESGIENAKNSLSDMTRHWSAGELHDIILQEFSNSDRPVDPAIIDAACIRLMMLEDITPSKENLHLYEERLMNNILRDTLGLPSEN